jgi:hypothetical protein
MEPRTRRSALRGGLMFLGGLVGLGGVRKAWSHSVSGERAAFRVYARGLDSYSGDRRLGRAPARGEPLTARGELLNAPDGSRIGELQVATITLLGPGLASPGAQAMEWHTFHLPGGTLIGSGTSGGSDDAEFAIVGGTGRYAGARGTYVRRLPAGEEGLAEFVIDLAP